MMKTIRTPEIPEGKQQDIVPMRRDRIVRAAALAAYEICSNCKTHNPARLDVYLMCVFHMLYTIIRLAVPGVVVPGALNRSTLYEADKRFSDVFYKKYAKLEWKAGRRYRPTQPGIVSQAMRMLPSARGGNGAQRFSEFANGVPLHLRTILAFMGEGVELIIMRQRWLASHKMPWASTRHEENQKLPLKLRIR